MEAKIFRDTVETSARLCDARAEVPVETEILIPDYLPQVFKIVKCFVWPVVLHKQPAAGRLTLEGYLRCVVFYQAEQDQALCTAEQKLPFSKTVEMPDTEARWVNVTATGETEYLNCRAVNQRRIDLRGACVLTVRAVAAEQRQAVTALAEAGLEQKLETVEGMQQLAAAEKLITAEDEIRFAAPPEAVLYIGGSALVQEVKLLAGKAVVKGEIQAGVLVRVNGVPDMVEKTVAFSQVLDMDGVDENCLWGGWAEMTGCALMAAGTPEGPETISATVMLHLRVWRAVRRSVVTDAFSTLCETELVRESLTTASLLVRPEQTVEVRCAGQLPDEGAQIVACLATVSQPEAAAVQDGCRLRGRAAAHIICLNSLGELECYDRSCEYLLPDVWDVPPEQMDLEVNAAVVSATARREGQEAAALLHIRVTGYITRRRATGVVAGVECGEALEPDENGVALRVYYAAAGEELFDIARRYHASPAAIRRAGGPEDAVLDRPMRLLIPVTG